MRYPLVLCLSAPFLFAISGCRDGARAVVRPPAAEFVLSAGDSAYWVSTDKTGVQWKGAPLDLARVDGRFVEVYVVDNDQSFQGADLVGQDVYRRDLQTGDSALVYRDTLVPHLAREYARLHPDDHRLGPDEEPDGSPAWRATATLDLGVAHGSFVSFSMHADVERDATPLWHTSRRGVLDLRGKHVASLADVAGDASGGIERRRDAAFVSALDSVRTSHDERGALASTQLAHYRIDPGSFEITTVEGAPAIAYGIPGSGPGDAGHMLPLQPIRFAEPVWWHDIAASLPMSSADGMRDVWRHGAYDIVVRYDPSGDGRLAIRDSTSREWPVATIASPATRVFWLDRPPVDSVTRHALAKAFQEAATYGDENRVASRASLAPRFRNVSARPKPINRRAKHPDRGRTHAPLTSPA
ncbi:MAG: hypothetical protein ABJE47_04455 [bacterium]